MLPRGVVPGEPSQLQRERLKVPSQGQEVAWGLEGGLCETKPMLVELMVTFSLALSVAMAEGVGALLRPFWRDCQPM